MSERNSVNRLFFLFFFSETMQSVSERSSVKRLYFPETMQSVSERSSVKRLCFPETMQTMSERSSGEVHKSILTVCLPHRIKTMAKATFKKNNGTRLLSKHFLMSHRSFSD